MNRKSFLIIYPRPVEETVSLLVLLQYFKRGIIDLVLSPQALELVQGQGKVNRVFTPDQVPQIRERCYDVAFDVHSGLMSGLVLALCRANEKITATFQTALNWIGPCFATKRFRVNRRLANESQILSLPMDFRRDSREWFKHIALSYPLSSWDKWEIDQLIYQVGRPKYLVAPGGRYKSMEIPVRRWIAFLHGLKTPVILYYHHKRERKMIDTIKDHVDDVVVVGEWPATKLQNLIGRMDAVVGIDNLAVQLTKTTNTRSLSFYGATRARAWAPEKEHFQNDCPFSLKFDRLCPQIGTCRQNHCMHYDSFFMLNEFRTFIEDWD